MAKRLYVVRIALFPHNAEFNCGALITEWLRYAGTVNVHRDTPVALVFDLFPPKSSFSESKVWADMNAERIRSFGINCQACPSDTDLD